MSLAGLVDADLERYITENRGDDRCWFFVHIPKTAGSSFRRELIDVLSPNCNIHVDRDRRSEPYAQKIVDATKSFNKRLTQRRYRFASGHVPIVTLAKHVDGWRDLKLITMLRDPVTRMISDYRYQTTSAHPTHREFLERYPTFESYLRTEWTRNRMFRFLRPTNQATVEDCIQFLVEDFAFVGLVEMYPLSVRLVTRLMERERSPSRHLRITSETEHNRIEVTPKLIEQVRELNSSDVALYSYFHAKLRAVREQVFRPVAEQTVSEAT
jgi:hypothetical protein